MVMVVVLIVLSLVARLVPHALEWFDSPVAEPFRSTGSLDGFRLISRLGSTEVTVVLAVAASALVWNRCRPLAVLYPLSVLGGLIVNVILKIAVGRSRPPMALTGTALDSFPSGHMIQAVIVLGMVPPVVYILTGRRSATMVTLVLAALGVIGVGISRIVLGAHWPTDVVGGAIVGVLALLGAEMMLDRHRPRWVPSCTDCHLHRAWGLRAGRDASS
jgi:membrane-associated phospholipid phosphatase